jgi:hypothetical protein
MMQKQRTIKKGNAKFKRAKCDLVWAHYKYSKIRYELSHRPRLTNKQVRQGEFRDLT